jgi:glycosyltransferase involved in cell wall biosynthesis
VKQKLPITGLVVTCNESKRLRQCLDSLEFCREILVIDLKSSDNCREIASKSGARVLSHPRVPIIEQLFPEAAPLALHDWILHTDPDEQIPVDLIEDIERCIDTECRSNVGIVELPYNYYFKEKRLRGTVWGGTRHLARLFHRDRVDLRPIVHRGIRLLDGFHKYSIPITATNAVRHFWVDSWEQFFSKHQRYIIEEGPGRYHDGERFRWRTASWEVLLSIYSNLLVHGVLKDGCNGPALAALYAWYVGASQLSLRRYQLGFGSSEKQGR